MQLSKTLAKIEARLEQAVSIILGEPYGVSEIEVYFVNAKSPNTIKVEFNVVGNSRHYEWTFDKKDLEEEEIQDEN